MLPWITLSISILALSISFLTLYFSRLKPGKVKMTRPTTIFLGPDGLHMENEKEKKNFIRTLLYSTSDKGQYIQNMYLRLQRGETVQNFNVWVYGDSALVRGSGLFVSKEGVSNNHHFLLPRNTTYDFLTGTYLLQVFVETINKSPYKIFEQTLSITQTQYAEVQDRNSGIYYDWAPNAQNYDAHVAGIAKKNRIIPASF